MRPQRAKIIRNRFGKHWHNTIGKINRITAFARFLIKRAVRADVMCYIGNGNKKTPAAIFGWFGKNRIVKIPRISPVNGHKRVIAKVTSAFYRRDF